METCNTHSRFATPRDEFCGGAVVRIDERGAIIWATCGGDVSELPPTHIASNVATRYRIEPIAGPLSIRRRRATREAA